MGNRLPKAVVTCRRKIPYASRQDAMRAADKASAEKQQTPYVCSVCRNWHLTSMTPADQRKLKRRIRNRSLVKGRDIKVILNSLHTIATEEQGTVRVIDAEVEMVEVMNELIDRGWKPEL